MTHIDQEYIQLAAEKINRYQEEAVRDNLTHRLHEIAIPEATALQICSDISHEQVGQWYSPRAWRCSLCIRMAQDGIPARMISAQPGYYACPAVKERFLKMTSDN